MFGRKKGMSAEEVQAAIVEGIRGAAAMNPRQVRQVAGAGGGPTASPAVASAPAPASSALDDAFEQMQEANAQELAMATADMAAATHEMNVARFGLRASQQRLRAQNVGRQQEAIDRELYPPQPRRRTSIVDASESADDAGLSDASDELEAELEEAVAA